MFKHQQSPKQQKKQELQHVRDVHQSQKYTRADVNKAEKKLR